MSGNKSETVDLFLPIETSVELKTWLLVCLYSVLFVVGVCGSTSFLTLTCLFYTQDQTQALRVCLCLLDVAHLLSLPMVALEQIAGYWLLGTGMCKVYTLLNSLTKSVSAIILTAMSAEVYGRMCWPQLRESKLVKRLFLCWVLLSVALVLPVVLTAETETVLVQEIIGPYRTTQVVVFECKLRTSFFVVFACCTFISGYLLPLGANCVFYCCIGRRAFCPQALVCFYFVCCTPYWLSVMYSVYLQIVSHNLEESVYLVHGIRAIYALPYVNSSLNWMLLGRMNKQTQQGNCTGLRSTTNTLRLKPVDDSAVRNRSVTQQGDCMRQRSATTTPVLSLETIDATAAWTEREVIVLAAKECEWHEWNVLI